VARDARDDRRDALAVRLGTLRRNAPDEPLSDSEWDQLINDPLEKYDPDEPRDYHGRWTSGFAPAGAQDFINARNTSTRVQYLSPLTPNDLSDHKLYMNTDKTVGVAISKDGDIQNVFNNGGPKGAGTAAVKWAIANGGTTLDCFDGFLPSYYKSLGFEEVSRVKFDRQYAPSTWDYAKAGEPDVVFMRLKR
jgi:hypothetical protein